MVGEVVVDRFLLIPRNREDVAEATSGSEVDVLVYAGVLLRRRHKHGMLGIVNRFAFRNLCGTGAGDVRASQRPCESAGQ